MPEEPALRKDIAATLAEAAQAMHELVACIDQGVPFEDLRPALAELYYGLGQLLRQP